MTKKRIWELDALRGLCILGMILFHLVYDMTTLGELKAREGETEFSHIPDWFAWQRQNVRR